jgi:hypothetical protein
MENPAEWRRAEKVINDAYTEWSAMTARGAFGLSLPAIIATRLRQHGILTDGDEPAIGWEGLKDQDPLPLPSRTRCAACGSIVSPEFLRELERKMAEDLGRQPPSDS